MLTLGAPKLEGTPGPQASHCGLTLSHRLENCCGRPLTPGAGSFAWSTPPTPPAPVSMVPGKPLNPVPQLAPAFLAWLQLVPEQAGGRLGKGGPCFGWVYTESHELGIQAIQQAGKGCHGKGVWQPLPLSHGPCP